MPAFLTRRLNLLLWGLLLAIVAIFVVRTLLPAQDRQEAFFAYYASGHFLASGHEARQLYDTPSFEQHVREVSHGAVRDVYLGNTPVLAVAWLPFAQLPVESARSLWVGLNVLFLMAVIALAAARVPRAHRLLLVVLLAALLTLAAPAREQMFRGQMYAFLLLLHTVGWQAYERGDDAVTGIALAIAMMVKLSGWPIGVLLLLRGRWRAVAWAAGAAIAIFVLTLPWVGLDAWREALFVQMPAAAAMPAGKLSAYQTVSSLWQHLFSFDAVFNPDPVADLPRLAVFGIMATNLAACATLLLRGLSAQVQYAMALVLTVLLSPLAEQYHYMLVMLPLALLGLHACLAGSWRLRLVLLLASVLLAAPINYKAYLPGLWALLDYPRLAAGGLIFFALISIRRFHCQP